MRVFISGSCLAEFIVTVELKPSLTSYVSHFLLELEAFFLTLLAHDTHNNPALQTAAGGSRCFSMRWRQSSMSSSMSATARGTEGLGYENEGWEHKW